MSIEVISFLRAVLFLGIPFVLLVFYSQYKWSKTCETHIRVLVALEGGGALFYNVPKEGDKITIEDTSHNTSRVWALNELATIEIPYPGVGFLPTWMQKTIRLAIINQGDVEPTLNRSPHKKNIASPDVVEFMKGVAEAVGGKDANMKAEIMMVVDHLATGPTREMVMKPEWVGALEQSGILKALATVSNELMTKLDSVLARLRNIGNLNPIAMYILLGLNLVITGFLLIQYMNAPDISGIAGDIAKIKSYLGLR